MMILIPSMIFISIPAYDIYSHTSQCTYLILTVVLLPIHCILFLKVSATDPGFIPQQTRPNYPLSDSDGLTYNPMQLSPFESRSFMTRINGAVIKLKYCNSCNM